MSTSDAIAIGAAILGTGLTVLGVVIAVASFWGIATLRQHAKETAEKAAQDQVLKLVTEGSDFNRKLLEEVQKRVESEADRLFADLSMAAAFPPGTPPAQGEGNVGEEYPPNAAR